MQSESFSVLVVTNDSGLKNLVTTLLTPPLFFTTIVSDINEAKRICLERNVNIIIADFNDGAETDFCIDLADSQSTVVLLTSQNLFEQLSYKVEPFGVITFLKTLDAFQFYSLVKIAMAVQYKIKAISFQAIKLKEKMEEIRIINRAKLILVQNQKMSEQDAHHFLEKEAMDKCTKKLEIAKEIIQKNE